MSAKLKQIVGKTIASAECSKTEASDGCHYASLILSFTDGSSQSFLFHAQPQIDAQFFKSDDDDPSSREVSLVRP